MMNDGNIQIENQQDSNLKWIANCSWTTIVGQDWYNKVRVPFQTVFHVFRRIPSNSHFVAFLVSFGNRSLALLDELVLPRLMPFTRSTTSIQERWKKLGSIQNPTEFMGSLSNPTFWRSRAIWRWFPLSFFHLSCNHSGTLNLSPAFLSQSLRSFAFNAALALASLEMIC